MTINSFAELTKKVHLLNDLILSDMVCDEKHYKGERVAFNKNLYTTKYWFLRISWANKRRYILTLLSDIRSAWALSLLLKSIWNCRPKDAVLSGNQYPAWIPYDQVPMDHNRTALPLKTLSSVMINGRKWFFLLEPEFQAKVIAELLSLSGGPIMWEVLRRAQFVFQRHRDNQLHALLECIVINDDRNKSGDVIPAHRKEDSGTAITSSSQASGKAQRELEANLATWNSIIKNLRESQKLEEVEMTFVDGTKQKLWKVNRPKPEIVETVDFLQLLPSSIGLRILSYLPRNSLAEYARVNRYWAFLVDELQAQMQVRQKIDNDLSKLQELMVKHDSSLEMVQIADVGGVSMASFTPSTRQPTSLRQSEKSAGGFSTAALHFDKLKPSVKTKQKPIRRLADLNDRLEMRGACDQNIWQWCRNVLKYSDQANQTPKENEGVFRTPEMHFPCPLMKYSLPTPPTKSVTKDPAYFRPAKPRKLNVPNFEYHIKEPSALNRRYNLWSRDFSGLYKVYKVPSYESPL